MLITLTTDASHNTINNDAGFAFYISSNAGTFKKWGKLRDCQNSCEAELMCIANGIYYCRTHPLLKNCTKIIVNTDLAAAGILIKGGSKMWKKKKRYRQIAGKVNDYVGKYNGRICEVEYRHVKAHTGNLTEPRKWVNDWVDKTAVKARKGKI